LSQPAQRHSRTRHPASLELPAPRYHQVYVALRGWIADGTYPPGARLPAEPELCRAFGVSRITLRRAVGELVEQGVLVRRQGSGTFVGEPSAARSLRPDLRELSRRVAGLGASTAVRSLRIDWLAPDAETCAALELPPTARVQRSSRVRLRDGISIGFITVWLPEAIGLRLGRAELRRSTVLESLERAGFRAAAAEQTIGAELAGLELARELGVAAGTPVVRVERVVRGDDGRPIERVLALWRADAYEYRMTLERGPRGVAAWAAE
jgi:GntR family transcriptional regulator